MDVKTIALIAGGITLAVGGGFAIKTFIIDPKKDEDNKEVNVEDVTEVLTVMKMAAERYQASISDDQLYCLVVSICLKAKMDNKTRMKLKDLLDIANSICEKSESFKGVKFEKN